jgi:hypothetical protein
VKRYFFNFRKGDEFSCDHVGMDLPNLDAARAEAIHAWRELIFVAASTGEVPDDCEIQITDEKGETVLGIPLGERRRVH